MVERREQLLIEEIRIRARLTLNADNCRVLDDA
jgi:hypothetical protein